MSYLTHPQSDGPAKLECRTCGTTFVKKRHDQAFCSDKCRSDFHRDRGMQGTVNRLQRVKGGVSVAIRLEGPAGEAALKLALHEIVRIVKL